MLYVYEKKSNKLVPIQEASFQKHKIMERKHLEEWVMNHPQLVGEELLVLTNEYSGFDKTKERLDILCLDRTGKVVIVELKREDSGKTVEFQALRYAAYCSTLTLADVVLLRRDFLSSSHVDRSEERVREEILSFIENDEFEEIDEKPRIIIMAKEFRPEVTATIIWLRTFGLDISCVRLTPYEINSDLIGLVSTTLIPLPEAKEYIIQIERKEGGTGRVTRSQQEYKEFFAAVSQALARNLGLSLPKPSGSSYYKIPAALPHTHFEWGFHGRPRSSFGVELHFEKGDRSQNVQCLQEMAGFKDDVERETGEELILQPEWGKAWSRMYVERQEGKMTEELKQWAVDTMEKFYRVLAPKLERLNL